MSRGWLPGGHPCYRRWLLWGGRRDWLTGGLPSLLWWGLLLRS